MYCFLLGFNQQGSALITLPGSWKCSREEQKCQKGICRAVEGVLCNWVQSCAPMPVASLLQKWQNVVAAGSRGSFSEQLFPVLSILATLRSVSPFCSGGRRFWQMASDDSCRSCVVKGGLLLLSPLPVVVKTPVLGNCFAITMGVPHLVSSVCGDLPFPGCRYPHWWTPCGNVLLLSSREPTPDSSCCGYCVLIKGLLFPAEYEAAMDRRFGLDPGTLFRGLKKVGGVTVSCFVVIITSPCPLHIQVSDLALEVYSNVRFGYL